MFQEKPRGTGDITALPTGKPFTWEECNQALFLPPFSLQLTPTNLLLRSVHHTAAMERSAWR